MSRLVLGLALGMVLALAPRARAEENAAASRDRTPHGVIKVVIKARPLRPLAAVEIVPRKMALSVTADAPSRVDQIAAVIHDAPF